MKKILRSHSEAALIVLAFIFLIIIVVYFGWGVGRVVGEVDRAVSAKGAGDAPVGFDLEAAGRLDLRGLVKSAP